MTTLVLAEHGPAGLSGATAKAVTAALQLGAPVHVLIAGSNVETVAADAAALAGVERVLCADHACFAHQLAEPVADLIVSIANDYDALLAPATARGKNVMPRVAALLDVMQVSDVVSVVSPKVFRRPIYAGNAIQTVEVTDPKTVLTIRISAFPAVAGGPPVAVQLLYAPFEQAAARCVKEETPDQERPDLAEASIIVSGGRAFGSKEKFEELLVPLARKLGAAIGASRAAVDAGFATGDLQVGQTGKVVAPILYIACGISGAIQHVAGMKDSKVIVAINKDPDAPIFQIADYGLVADVFEATAELTARL